MMSKKKCRRAMHDVLARAGANKYIYYIIIISSKYIKAQDTTKCTGVAGTRAQGMRFLPVMMLRLNMALYDPSDDDTD